MNRFLLVRTGALGDIIHGLPVAAALKEAYPHLRLDWVVEERYAELLRCVPVVDACVPVRFKQGVRGLADPGERTQWLKTLRTLRRAAYDVTLDLQGLIRSGMVAGWTRAPFRVGFSGDHVRERPNCLFSNVRPKRMPVGGHVIDRNLCLLHPLGIRSQGVRAVSYRVPEEMDRSAEHVLRTSGRQDDDLCVAVHPVAGWPTKEWRPERYAEILRRLAGVSGIKVFLLWGPGERERVVTLRKTSGSAAHLIPRMGPAELLAFLKKCDLYLGGDSGPMQMASSLGKPVVALFGPTDPERNGPFYGRYRVVWGRAACAPCYKRRCSRRDCMDAVNLDSVWEALLRFLEEIRGERGARKASDPRVVRKRHGKAERLESRS
jgi:lipopolysaccharide heptosyltransferase I